MHAEEDAAVGEGFGQVPDGGDDFGAPGGETDEAVRGAWRVERAVGSVERSMVEEGTAALCATRTT